MELERQRRQEGIWAVGGAGRERGTLPGVKCAGAAGQERGICGEGQGSRRVGPELGRKKRGKEMVGKRASSNR